MKFHRHIHHHSKRNPILTTLAVISAAALIVLLATNGATILAQARSIFLELESGSRTNVAEKTDSSASGGRYIQFSSAADSTPASSPTPTPDPEPEPTPQPPSSWQAAWDSRDYNTIRSWYRNNTGIKAADLNDSDLAPSGSITSSSDDQVIEGKLVNGTINIRHKNVTVKNTKIVNSGNSIAVNVGFGDRDIVNWFNLENVSIIGTGDTEYRQAVGGTYAPVHATRVYISGFGGGFRLSAENSSQPDYVEYSMVENIKIHPGSHNTGLSFRGGDNKRITRSWIEGSTSSAVSLYPDSRPISYFTAQQNLFDGGTYSILGGDGKVYGPDSKHRKFINNLFTRNHQYGPLSSFVRSIEGNEWSGNYYLDGTLIP